MPLLILIRGIPGSGKSTLARMLRDSGKVEHHFEADMYFMKNGVYCYEGEKIGAAHHWCLTQTFNHLKIGRNVVVSNTFTKDTYLKEYRNFTKSVPNLAIQEIICIGNFGNIHNVPEETMKNFRQQAWWLKGDQK